ncbi:MAG: hypothetical protein NTW66_02185, partial [Candidatus Magasanikbacteria bacterium]|nr:hypothetical protein [Candidatus Magasanikbacteria bacterium]
KLEQQVQTIAAVEGIDLNADPADLNVGGGGGAIAYSGAGDLNVSGNAILNVLKIVAKNSNWAIDENGLLIAKVTTSQGDKNIYGMASESAEITISGTGTLQMGEVLITFATDTQEIIDESAPLKVNVTLTSIDAKGVAVIEKTVQGFKVKELDGGSSNATFDWMVIAKRKILLSEAGAQTDPSSMNNIEPPASDGGSSAETPPIEQPAAETPPAETPPAETPPVENPPVEAPPAETPPAEQPPAESPPAETPPAESPPADTGGNETSGAPTP